MPNWADVVYWGLVQLCGAVTGRAAGPPDAEGTFEEAGSPAEGEAEGEADAECVGLALVGREVRGMAAVCGAAATSGAASAAAEGAAD
jgi:hypothetical protein